MCLCQLTDRGVETQDLSDGDGSPMAGEKANDSPGDARKHDTESRTAGSVLERILSEDCSDEGIVRKKTLTGGRSSV